MSGSLQWGGRFSAAPDAALLQFGSSLEEDLLLAPFDVRCSQAHVHALEGGGIIGAAQAAALREALRTVESEIASGAFAPWARASGAEDVHGAVDARVRELAPETGELLHAGRSRNDQVATTLLLYAAQRAAEGKRLCADVASQFCTFASAELDAGTLLAASTHWQPAQPVLLAFWLAAAAEPFARDAQRFADARDRALSACPLGSGAVAGSSLPLDRAASAAFLGFAAPSRNAMDAIGNRDAALDVAHAFVRATLDASRICEEFVIWCTPNFGYLRLGDEASTGSSLMPQKRNPDPFELVRGISAELTGLYAGALATLHGTALSYHRDLQIAKRAIVTIVERALAALHAFSRALSYVRFDRERMSSLAGAGFTAATDVADALIANGQTARSAHAAVGAMVLANEPEGSVAGWPTARESVEGKRTAGSTQPSALRTALRELSGIVAALAGEQA